MYGGPDYGRPQYINDATQSIAQAGLDVQGVHARRGAGGRHHARLALGRHSGRVFTDVNGSTTKPIANEDHKSYGRITLLQATEDSVNTVFVDVENQPQVGAAKVVQAARDAGIPDDVADRPDAVGDPRRGLADGARHGLGVRHVRGRRAAQRADRRDEGRRRQRRRRCTSSRRGRTRAFDQDVAAQVDYALQKVVTDGTGTEARARRPPGRRQDRHHRQQPVRLVRRLHPAAVDGRGAVPDRAGRTHPRVADRRRRRRPGQRRVVPGGDLDRVHDARRSKGKPVLRFPAVHEPPALTDQPHAVRDRRRRRRASRRPARRRPPSGEPVVRRRPADRRRPAADAVPQRAAAPVAGRAPSYLAS